ncbi:MAG: sigma-70 family RNA polymerase sigma factor [Planctomycetes bacterium]|nr:sigma-70 family RNA polymerase sigma factor [Planctomycetota bacterium]
MSIMRIEETPGMSGSGQFEATPWSLVRASKDVIALDALLRSYWKPLYFFVRRHGYDAETSRDIVQDFVAMLLQREAISRAEPSRGRFRTFLLAALTNFMKDRLKAAHREKRGGGRQLLSLDFTSCDEEYSLQVSESDTPETALNRAWARGLWEQAVGEVRGEPAHLEAFRMHLAHEGYEAIEKKTGLSRAAAKSAVHRLNAQLREIVLRRIRETVADESELEAEVAQFISLLA